MTDHGTGAEGKDDSAILIPLHERRRERDELPVTFHRRELDQILKIYGTMVAAGEWRDYAISSLREIAVFSVFRRTAETPLYRIEKRPKLRHRQGQFSVLGPEGQVLRRGDELAQVLKVFDARRFRVIE